MMNRVDQLVQFLVADKVMDDDVAKADEKENRQGIE